MTAATTLNPDLIAPCGMNCAICASYLALKNDVKSKGVKISYCTGCRPRNKNCSFIKKQCTAIAHGEVAFCFECSSFPCGTLKSLDSKYKTRYRMSMIDNLNFIKEHGLQSFLAAQEKTWKCPDCGELVSCHNGLCFNCGLETLRNKKEKYKWQE